MSLQPQLNEARNTLAARPAHLMTILNGAVANFNDTNNPLRLHNTATAIRELLREFLSGLAPNDQIKLASWYIPDPTSDSGVTRRHRVYFSIYRFLEESHFDGQFVASVTEIAGDLIESIRELSALTHISAATMNPDIDDSIHLFKRSLALFTRLVVAIEEGTEHIKSELQDSLQDSLSAFFTSQIMDALDQLSSHTRPQDADGIQVSITEVKADGVYFSGTGNVNCDMQFGSDGDCRRGDGIEWEDSFPFTFSGKSELSTPFTPAVERNDIEIDTSSFYDETE